MVPKLSADNVAFWLVFLRILPGLFRDQNYDYGAIEYVFKVHKLSSQKQAFYLDKCLAVINIIQAIRAAKRGESNQNRADG